MYLLKESSDFSFEYRASHDFSRAIRICGSFFCARGSLHSQILASFNMGQSSTSIYYDSSIVVCASFCGYFMKIKLEIQILIVVVGKISSW